jgi:hypothetical protein
MTKKTVVLETWRRVVWQKYSDVSEKPAAFINGVDKQAAWGCLLQNPVKFERDIFVTSLRPYFPVIHSPTIERLGKFPTCARYELAKFWKVAYIYAVRNLVELHHVLVGAGAGIAQSV